MSLFKVTDLVVYYNQMGTLQFSRFSFILLLFLFTVDCSDVNLEVKSSLIVSDNGTNTITSSSKQGVISQDVVVGDGVRLNISELVGSKNNGGGQEISGFRSDLVRKDQVGVRSNKSELVGSKDGGDQGSSGFGSDLVLKDQDGVSNMSELVGTKNGGGQKIFGFGSNLVRKDQDGADSKIGELKEGSEVTSGLLLGIEKEKLRDEECDPSYMCVDETKNLTACLRVPGNDSPDLSLLIQNRGKKPVTVTITAPDFVQLEETKVQLQEKEDKKVKVSIIAYKVMDSVILLTAKDSHCKLDLKELIRHDSRVEDTRYAFNLKNLSNFTRNHFIIFLALTAFLLLGCGWAYMGSHKKLLFGNGYKAMDVQLPVSVPVPISETNDGWDKSWNDGWDDEEAPMTPTLPVTPNLSSRGLASRRLNKEAWKD